MPVTSTVLPKPVLREINTQNQGKTKSGFNDTGKHFGGNGGNAGKKIKKG